MPPSTDINVTGWGFGNFYKVVRAVSDKHYVLLYKEIRDVWCHSTAGGWDWTEDYFYLLKNFSDMNDLDIKKQLNLELEYPKHFQ